LSAYLDTHVAVRFAMAEISKLSPAAIECSRNNRLLLSAMSLMEMEYLHELGKIIVSADDLRRKLDNELGVQVCKLGFDVIGEVACREKWTRDPFDRLIVANARANGLAPLITADRLIRKHYARAVW
jgi:PIN domain nuclease of toxin-antitoxin system